MKTLAAYANARNYYRKAIEIQGTNFWVITQYLSMIAVSRLAEEKNQKGRKHKAPPADQPRELGDWWSAARQICRWELPTATGDDRAYIYGTLAELELLGRIYGEDFDEAAAQEEIRRCCKEILAVCSPESFPLQSTLRQFRRYLPLLRQNWRQTRLYSGAPSMYPNAWFTPGNWQPADVSPFARLLAKFEMPRKQPADA